VSRVGVQVRLAAALAAALAARLAARLAAALAARLAARLVAALAARPQVDQLFAPADPSPHKLVHGQRVEELVRDQQDGLLRQLRDGGVPVQLPGRHEGLESAALRRAVEGRHLEQVHAAHRLAEGGEGGGRAEQVRHQGAPAGPRLGQPHPRGPAQRLPRRDAPHPDQLAKGLADLGRRGEVARAPKGVAPHVVAVLRVREREAHVLGDRERAAEADAARELPQEASVLVVVVRAGAPAEQA